MNVVRSAGLFAAAGLAETGGGYLVWRWLREGASWPAGLAGAIILVAYGVIPTFQATGEFGRGPSTGTGRTATTGWGPSSSRWA